MTGEQKRLENEIGDLEPLRLITETDEEYKASLGNLYPYRREIFNWLSRPLEGEMAMEMKYLEALRGIHAWVCVEGHCCWEGDYMLADSGIIAECPVKQMLDSVEFHKYLGLDTMPNADGKCPYYKEGRQTMKGEREVRLSLDQIERSLRDTKVMDDGEAITQAHIEPGELVVKLVRDEAETEP